ncbi:DUF1744-domain-containing protein [Auricularia subglabra TFB-10046 SS5]|nr:DUF1744-domain-containing protein [Auricularia subglabra TFB-10046 SS5]
MPSRGNFRGNFRGGGRGRGRGGAASGSTSNGTADAPVIERGDDGTRQEERYEEIRARDDIDAKLGFARLDDGPKQEGWLVNMQPTLVKDPDWPTGRAAVDFYFIQDDGGMFKCTYEYDPYFYIACKLGTETVVEEWLMKKYEGLLIRVVRQKKEDLKLPNHLMGHRKLYLQLCFKNVTDLLAVRRDIMPLALANSAKMNAVDAYAEVVNAEAALRVQWEQEARTEAWGADGEVHKDKDPRESIVDIREFDVPYFLRVAIDNEIRVGLWYTVTFSAGKPTITRLESRVQRAEPVVMAYDIETTKAPLKFPDQQIDQVMMISYMIDGQGFLITNRDIISEDIDDFEYTPKEGYEGPFTVFNEPDEAATIKRFFQHIQTAKPTVMATFNGDFFDFPFLCARAKVHDIDMLLETGFAKDSEDEFKSNTCVHMDCFRWVKRDSYLPQGSQGLKAVTTAKLGYNPIELDPELMTPYALEQPQTLAQYSVSDAVATYYLYMKYVHPFIFSLCTIIPLRPDEVLRKGSGTLCETLLMVEAYRAGVIFPNKHEDPHGNTFEGHLLASETYVGGHVEALEAGVFRADIPTHFKIVPSACQELIDGLDAALKFCIVEESKMDIADVTNYEDIKSQIQSALEEMRDNPMRMDKPRIYHLDVAAMYPNIMLSNRLQPDSVVDEATCAVCDYNRPGKTCDRRMTWAWRGEYYPAQRDEYNMIRHALAQEMFPPRRPGLPKRRFVELGEAEQAALLHKRLGDYSRKVYKKTKETRVVEREAIICQRENPFYVETVRTFRDRRYEYKGLHKTWKKNLDNLASGGSVADIEEAKKMIVLYDSLQLAHKCILNSFYGYVNRKGARWQSMEMAGITCLTGAHIIQMARQLVEQIGRPLELDTDGIWCMLPDVFPEDFTFQVSKGKPLKFSYPCTMLNHLVHDKFTNHQYHDLEKETGEFKVHSENSIFFELDGPYLAMILPSSKEEDKLLKKRYAVFNYDKSLAELKGFEVKRRGELQLIKIFQSEIFDKFLLGSTTEECYAAVAEIANQWLDILFSRANSMSDDELFELIAENRSMSRTLAEYAGQKSTSISTAKRLAEFLGEQMVKDKGLACKFIISAKPIGAPVTERAVPVAIFSADEAVKRTYLRRWLKDNSLSTFDLRSILDWDYYIERLGSVIQKLITIPAAMQKVSNPVPRIRHPDWLFKRVAALDDKFHQHKVTDFFKPATKQSHANGDFDMEDIAGGGRGGSSAKKAALAKVTKKAPKSKPPPVIPDPNKDYSGYLRAMRPIWRERHAARATSENTIGMPSMFRGARIRSYTAWDVVQIRPTRIPGRFALWLSTGSDLVSITLRIPREFYINLKRAPSANFFDPGYLSEQVARTLPRNRPSGSLWKVTVPEEVYLGSETHFAELTNNTNVDGVYELEVLHVVRAILRLGNSCSPAGSSYLTLNKARDDGVDLTGLEHAPPSVGRPAYLQGGSFKYLFLYHASSGSSSVNVFALFTPRGRARLHVVDPATRRQPLARLQETYLKARRQVDQRAGLKDSVIEYPEQFDFDVSYHKTESAAQKAVSRDLGLLEKEQYVLVISSAKGMSWHQAAIPKVERFPVVMMTSSLRSTHSLELNWHVEVVKRMCTRYLAAGPWLHSLVGQATYYNVPIGNVESDRALFFADVDFARRLLKEDMILWWSSGSRPDLGGIEDDVRTTEEVINPQLVVPGCYDNVCLSVQVRNLAINSVLQSSLVNEMEGAGGSTAFDSTLHTLNDHMSGTAQSSTTLGDAAVSPLTFNVIKSMVRSWLLDKARDLDGPADLVISHFWRWMSSIAAQMHDPGLMRFVHGLMHKTFMQMLAEFKRLGSNVVAADFGSILLVTSKPPGTAYAYGTYLKGAVTSHELFKHMYLEIDRYYDYLVYMDNANQAAVVCQNPQEVEPPKKSLAVTMAWNIENFLPPAVQRIFHESVNFFMISMYRIKREHAESSRLPLQLLRNLTLTQDAAGPKDSSRNKEMEAVRSFIATRLTRKMLRSVSNILEEHKEALMQSAAPGEFAFPVLPGSHLTLHNPALEFVKAVCAVFALAKDFKTEIGILKRNMLDLVGVREFAEEAVFRNPCEPFTLTMVICPCCADMRDMDFCRDVDLLPSAPGARSAWQCAQCGYDFDKQEIDFALVSIIERLEASFTTQDLRCSKCKQVRSDNVSKHCICSGEWRYILSKAEFRRRLRTAVNVATVHNLPLLRDSAQRKLDDWS